MTDGWITQQDPESGDEYYYNTFTGQSSWIWPPEGLDLESTRGQYYNTDDQNNEDDPYYQDNLVDGSVGRGPKKMSPKWVRALNKVRAAVSLKRKFLKPVWEKHFDDGSGKPYYYNTVTKQSSWEEPATFHSSVPTSPSHRKQKGFGFADPTSINRLKKLGDTVSKDDIQHEEERKIKFESLFKACKNGDLSVVKACIKKPSPIDVDDTNIKGSTALHVASEAGHENIVQYLLEVGKANINCRDNRKYTPLINACNRGHLRVAFMLLRHGADYSLRQMWGMCAYDMAKYRGYASICHLFEDGVESDKIFDTKEIYVDRKWFKYDLHLVRHGTVNSVKVDDTHFYIKTQFSNKTHQPHDNLH